MRMIVQFADGIEDGEIRMDVAAQWGHGLVWCAMHRVILNIGMKTTHDWGWLIQVPHRDEKELSGLEFVFLYDVMVEYSSWSKNWGDPTYLVPIHPSGSSAPILTNYLLVYLFQYTKIW